MILHEPRLQGLHHRLVTFVRLAGQVLTFDVLVTAGRRTDAEQLALYARGRTTQGEPPVDEEHPLGHTVTDAMTARESAHGRGAAVDLCPVVDGEPAWNDTAKFEALGTLAKRQGLVWGGDWPRRDAAHFEVPGWKQMPFP